MTSDNKNKMRILGMKQATLMKQKKLIQKCYELPDASKQNPE